MNSTKNILKITYPIFLTLVAQNVVNLTDTAFLGRVSEVALGASAIAGVFFFAIYVIGFGFSQGAQILIGRRNGEQNYSQIGPVFNNGLVFIVFLSLFFFLLTFFGNAYMLKVMVSSPDIYKGALEYLDWRIYGFFFAFANTMFRGFYVGITQTRILTVSAVITTVTNIILDYILIFGHYGFPEMGIAGAALASVIAEAASTLYLIFHTISNKELKKYELFRRIALDFKAIGQILNLSVFIMFQFFISISTWFVFFLFIERMGERPLAVTNIGRSMYIFLMIPAQALSTTVGTLVSNLIGAGQTDQVMRTTSKIMRITTLVAAPFLIFTFFFPELFAHIYTDDNGLRQAAIPVIKVVSVAVAFFAIGNVIVNAVSGTGNTKIAFIFEVLTLFFYISYVYVTAIVYPQPVYVVWMSEFVYWSIIAALGYIYLRTGKWKGKQI